LRRVLALALCLPLLAAGQDVFTAIRENRLAALKGADLTVRDRRGNTPLLYAAAYGSLDAVRTLLAAGADVNARNGFDATPLIWAASNPEKARFLVEHGADVHAKTKQGRTALMIAAACDGCSDLVKLLIAKGADAKMRDTGGTTALQLAAENGDIESVRALLAAGADAKGATGIGLTPLYGAALNCDVEAARLLLEKGEVGLTPLILSSMYCRPEMIDTLIEAGADVNAKDTRGMTPLMMAVASETQDAAVVRRLVHAGADVNAKSAVGETALDWARKFGDRDVISILTAEGAHEALKYSAPERGEAPARTVKAAVSAAASLLQRSAREFFQRSGCVGCHHQTMAALALSSAKMDSADFVKMIVSELTGAQDKLLQRFDPGGGNDGEGYAGLALSAAGYRADGVTDTLAVHTAMMQRKAGNWHVGDASRSPLQESEIARTARAMRVLQLYGPPALKPEFERRIGRARDWLLEAHAKTNDDFAMQLLAAFWSGAPRAKVKALGTALTGMQRPDGGWAQNANLASDAYATGESLWALSQAGVLKPSDAAYQRGVKYLLATQWPDGSWHVRSRAPKFQPYFESGFPFGYDQWISSAGTAWAVLALAPSIAKDTK
jgi:ankyrin repeat protein